MAENDAKAQVAATDIPQVASGGLNPAYRRRDQIAEALWDLEQVFYNPGCFDSLTADDAAESLASEFVGAWRDDEILHRLANFREAEADHRIKEAERHLTFVRRKLKTRWGITPLRSAPLAPAGTGEYPAWRQKAHKARLG